MRQKRTAIQFSLLCLLFLFAPLSAVGKPVPLLQGRVVDNAKMLSTTAVQLLESTLATFEAEDSTQIVVLTIGSLEGENLEEFSLKVVEKWQIGQKESDNGALLLISKDDRKVRIEVGYGLEGSLTDLIAGRIIREIITPQFRNGNFDQGIIDGISAMIGSVRGEFNNSTPLPSGNQSGDNEFGGFLIFFLFAFFQLGRILHGRKWIAAGIGAVIAPLIGSVFFGSSGLILLVLVLTGLGVGFLSSIMGSNMHSGGSASGTTFGGSSGGFSSGSFGGGGFSGGGGGFGGGGSSGGW